MSSSSAELVYKIQGSKNLGYSTGLVDEYIAERIVKHSNDVISNLENENKLLKEKLAKFETNTLSNTHD